MAQSHTWSIRGRRDSLNWDVMTDKNNGSNSMRPSTTSPAIKLSTEIVRPEDQCAWCGQNEIGEGSVRGGQLIDGLYHSSSSSPNGGVQVFCSDVCFSQCRRAALKRAKVCDWCKHVRHTVSYVDLNDGRRQLQFCTDKCRNQYKMQLFCAEASSLGVQPTSTANNTCSSTAPSTSTASSEGSTPPASSSIDPPIVKNNSHSQPFSTGAELLITPELWMTDCHLKENDFAGMASFKKEKDVNHDVNAAQITLSSSNSDVEEQDGDGDAPLNLIHSSRRNGYTTTSTIKRKASQVDEGAISKSVALQPISKKGKSHRKSSLSYFPPSSLSLPPPPPPPLLSFPASNQSDRPTGWPGIPYPHLAHPSFFLQSQFLSLNHSLAKHSNLLPQTPVVTAPNQFQPEVVTEKPIASTSGNKVTKETLTESSSGQEEGIKKEGESIAPDESFKRSVHPTMPPNFVVIRVPILVPLPIPVPIPIPLNVHEKYLKQLLT